MSKPMDFSFCAKLPAYQTTRHCCGLVRIRTLYLTLTPLVIVQLVLLLVFCFLPDLFVVNFTNSATWNQGNVFVGSIVLCSVWLISLVISVIGCFKKRPFLHWALLICEIAFSVFCLVIVSLCLWNLPQRTRLLLMRLCASAALFSFHSYYTFVVFSLYSDVKARRKTEAFVARQMMIDEVCEEMLWEEMEEAERMHTSHHHNGRGHYLDYSSFSEPSVSSFEMRNLSSQYSSIPLRQMAQPVFSPNATFSYGSGPDGMRGRSVVFLNDSY
ncbi:unnamed protein product [Caenorhabditis sp. 36 PRJEB53466]|nr:unnamed protein product [Caenorhabditis sp. 36 PRJEB53466]